MNALNFDLSAKASATHADAGPLPSHSHEKFAEPFESLMNRALAQDLQPNADSAFAKNFRKDRPRNMAKGKSLAARESELKNSGAPVPTKKKALDDKAEASIEKTELSKKDSSEETSVSPTKQDEQQDTSGNPDLTNFNLAVVPGSIAPVAPEGEVSLVSDGAVESVQERTIAETMASKMGEIESGKVQSDKKISKEISKLSPRKLESDGKKVSVQAEHPAKKSGSSGGAVPVDKLLAKAELSKEMAVNTVDFTSSKPGSEALDSDGISVAEQPATMKNADQAEKISGQAEQTLPEKTDMPPLDKTLARQKIGKVGSLVSTDAATDTAAARVSEGTSVSADNMISQSAQSDLRTRALDRTHDIVALHAMRMKDSNTDSLHVVIKPGAGLELSLQLKQTGSGIEAQATLNHGDFDQLNQHWAELQQRLEQRGIKLAPLGNQENASAFSNSNFQNHQHQSTEREPLATGAFAEFALAGKAAEKSATRVSGTPVATTGRGWESWA
jgi:hypothetical protein